jgi:RNA polymerase sigma-70 factor (ECF subfamily)
MEAGLDPEPLVTRVLDGDRQAFAGLVLGFERPLFGFLGRMGLDQARAEEVAQETFLRAWQYLGEYAVDQNGGRAEVRVATR